MSNTSIQVFSNPEFGEIRTTGDSEHIEFIVKDVCDFFGITNRNRIMQQLDADEKGGTRIATPGGEQEFRTVTEAGLYHLLFILQPKEARGIDQREIDFKFERIHRFKRWVTHEVLPSIRRSGGYIATNGTETNEELLARAVLVAQDAIKRKDKQIAELEPKARFADAVAASDGTCLVGELAKMLRQEGVEIGQNRLFEWMRKGGYLGNSGSNRNVPTQRAMEQGLFRIKETVIAHADGHTSINRTPKITGKGQTYFIRRFLSDEEYA